MREKTEAEKGGQAIPIIKRDCGGGEDGMKGCRSKKAACQKKDGAGDYESEERESIAGEHLSHGGDSGSVWHMEPSPNVSRKSTDHEQSRESVATGSLNGKRFCVRIGIGALCNAFATGFTMGIGKRKTVAHAIKFFHGMHWAKARTPRALAIQNAARNKRDQNQGYNKEGGRRAIQIKDQMA